MSRRARGDRGSAALVVAILAPAMILAAGLVIDGGGALEARQRAADMAEQAARAAANRCDRALLRSFSECRIAVGGQALHAVADEYVFGDGVSYDLRRVGPAAGGGYYGVEVTVRIAVPTVLLGVLPGFETMTVEQTATAVAVTGR